MKDFTGKVVVVTGSSMGIGKAVARMFAAKKAKVVLNGRNRQRLEAIVNEFKQCGYDVYGVSGDISNEGDCERLIKETIEQYGRIDILIKNAGVSMRGEVNKLSPGVINTVFKINTIGPFILAQKAIPHIVMSKGSIVFISSLAGLKGLPGLSAYSASKMALTALAASLRIEHARDDVHIGIVYVGYTQVEKGKTTLGVDGELLVLEERTGRLQHSIEEVAEKILLHVENRERISFTGLTGYLYSFLLRYFPGIMERLIIYQQNKIARNYK
jgi:short-subunit dehydrogenase